MLTRKTRILFAAAAAVVAIAVLPASSFALKAKPTGNPQLDDYCQQAAALIDRAITQGNLALVNGDEEGANEWYHLAAEMIERSQGAGCSFSARRKIRRILDQVDIGPRQTISVPPAVGTAPDDATGSLHPPPSGTLVGGRRNLAPVVQ